MIDYNKPPLGYLVRAASSDLDSPLDLSGRERAEAAAQFLSFERIGGVASCALTASLETAEIILNACGQDQGYIQGLSEYESPEVICAYLLDAPYPFVLVLRDREIQAAIARLMPGANVCKEIVGPGGVISVHRVEEKILVRARTMILDFTFAECSEYNAKLDDLNLTLHGNSQC